MDVRPDAGCPSRTLDTRRPVTARQKASETLGWTAMALGVVVVLWSVDAFVVGPPSLNELDIIDLVLCGVIAGTLGVVGLRLRAGRSPWRPLVLGVIVSLGLCVLALLKAAQDFNGPH
ncbi:MAG: hypothetical protein ACXVWF_04140 [Actinomycetota bacterium]